MSSPKLYRPLGGIAGEASTRQGRYHQGGSLALRETRCLWSTPLKPANAVYLSRDDPGPPCVVGNREGCRETIRVP